MRPSGPYLPPLSVPSWADRAIVFALAIASLVVGVLSFAGQLWWQGLVLLVISLAFASVNWLLDTVFEQGWMAAAMTADQQLEGRVDALERDRLLAQMTIERPSSRAYATDLAGLADDLARLDPASMDLVAAQVRRHGPR